MKAEDTVMMPEQTRAKRKQLFPHGHKDCFECEQFVKQDQAEISFPEGKKEGIREVVDWLKKHEALQTNPTWTIDWENKLKEWGINDKPS